MAAPTGNEFWKLRDRDGRKKLFETPAALWAAALSYFEWVRANPWIEYQQTSGKGKPTVRIEVNDLTGEEEEIIEISPALTAVPIGRPMTLIGCCLHMGINSQYFRDFEAALKPEDPHFEDFSLVIKGIKDIINNQQIEGAMLGAYKENLVARLQGIADTSKLQATGKDDAPLFPPSPLDSMTKEELLKLKYGGHE